MSSSGSPNVDPAASTRRAPDPTQPASSWAMLSRRRLGLALAGIAWPMLAKAHDFWVQPSTFTIAPGDTVNLVVLVGHGRARERSPIGPDRITRLDVLGPDGSRDLRPGLRAGGAAGPSVTLEKRGLHLVALETNSAYSELPGLRFTDYLQVEGLTPALALRAQRHLTDAPGRERYSRRAKALIQVGDPSPRQGAIATRRLGMSLELVLERDPYTLAEGETLPVKVFYEGAPLSGALVKLNNLDFDDRPVATQLTDASGRAIFHLPRVGNWQLNVIWTKPITGDPKVDFETTFSSLTFGFPRHPR